VSRLPDGGRLERRRLRESAEAEPGAMLVYRRGDLRREVGADRTPVRSGRAVAKGSGGAALPADSEDDQCEERGQGCQEEGP
jgi:hypothetical protein